MFALCVNGADGFEYAIAGLYEGGQVPQNMKLFELPESDYAVFSAKGPLPGSLQQLNADVWQNWYPAEGQRYEANGSTTVEVYSAMDPQSPDYVCGMWVPIKKKPE